MRNCRYIEERTPRVSCCAAGGWREAVMAEAIEKDDGYGGEAFGTLLAGIRLHLPGSAQAIVRGVGVGRALDVLREEVSDVRSAVSGSLRRHVGGEDSFVPYWGWYTFSWEGEKEVEMAAAPDDSASDLVFVSNSRAAAEGAADFVVRRSRPPKGRCLVFSSGRWRDAPDLDAEVKKASWEEVVLSEEISCEIQRSVERFFERRESYRQLGFAWRRGILLIGPPGTGKTMVVKAVAASRPELPFLYVRDLEGHGEDWAIGAIFQRARALAPTILAFEDIDGLVNAANRSVFLNELDGFASNDGLLIVASSNHPERIDEALLKRPSRFDRVFYLGPPSLPERERYLRELLSRPPLVGRFSSEGPGEAARRVAERTEGFTPAHLKEAVLSAALELAHEGEQPLATFEEAVLAQADALRAYLRRAEVPEKLGELRAPGRPLGFGT